MEEAKKGQKGKRLVVGWGLGMVYHLGMQARWRAWGDGIRELRGRGDPSINFSCTNEVQSIALQENSRRKKGRKSGDPGAKLKRNQENREKEYRKQKMKFVMSSTTAPQTRSRYRL